jgi:hypothetical protein
MEEKLIDINDLVFSIYRTNEFLQEYMLQGEVDELKDMCKLLLGKLEDIKLYYFDE